jgi:hypothetical protein
MVSPEFGILELFFSDTPDKIIEALVAEAEKASKR